jgi:hypothetical protein
VSAPELETLGFIEAARRLRLEGKTVRYRTDCALTSPVTEVSDVSGDVVTVTFLGLTGFCGTLPLVLRSLAQKSERLAKYLNTLNNEIVALYGEAIRQYRPELGGSVSESEAGVKEARSALLARSDIQQGPLTELQTLRLASLLEGRELGGLQAAIEDLFGAPARVSEERPKDGPGALRIELGPLDEDRLCALLPPDPGGERIWESLPAQFQTKTKKNALRTLLLLCRLFRPLDGSIEVVLHSVKRPDQPSGRLWRVAPNRAEEQQPRTHAILGVNAWLKPTSGGALIPRDVCRRIEEAPCPSA